MINSACKLNKQVKIYSLDICFSQFWTVHSFVSGSNCCFLTCLSYLQRQVRWSGIPISLRIFNRLLWSTQSKSLVSKMKQMFFCNFLASLWSHRCWQFGLWYYRQYASKYGKLSRGHRTRKGQFSFQFQRKAMPKNAQTTAQLHSSHMLVK